jgi:photosystem II reaction center protein PsbP
VYRTRLTLAEMKIIISTLFPQTIHCRIVLSVIVMAMMMTSLIFASPMLLDVNSILFQPATAQQQPQKQQQHRQPSLSIPTLSSSSLPPPQSANTSSNYLTYDNPLLGIKMQYPANWSVREYAYNNSAAYNVVAGFYSPSKTGSQLGNVSGVSGNFIPYLDIFVFASNGMSLNDIVQQRINNFLNNSNFAIDSNESKPFTIHGNHPAYMLVYTVTVGADEFFRKMQAWTIFDNKMYVITFTSQQALFSNYIPIVDKMVNSFEIQTKTK